MTLTEFLLARIAEDERLPYVHMLLCARLNLDYEYDDENPRTEPYPCTCHYPERILRECEAKRRIVAEVIDVRDPVIVDGKESPIICLLALPYADHPDFDPAWRVS